MGRTQIVQWKLASQSAQESHNDSVGNSVATEATRSNDPCQVQNGNGRESHLLELYLHDPDPRAVPEDLIVATNLMRQHLAFYESCHSEVPSNQGGPRGGPQNTKLPFKPLSCLGL